MTCKALNMRRLKPHNLKGVLVLQKTCSCISINKGAYKCLEKTEGCTSQIKHYKRPLKI